MNVNGTRRRYDTMELVTEMRRERRNAIVLGLAGVAVLLVLLLLYFTLVDQGGVPEAPDVAPEAGSAIDTEASPAETTPPTPGSETPAATTPAAAAPTKVTVILPQKAAAWIDETSLGKVKEQTVEVTPGAHELRVKLGKRTLTQPFEATAGQTTEVRLDPRAKKKGKTKKAK